MKRHFSPAQLILSLAVICSAYSISAQTANRPVIKNGEAQIVPEFSDPGAWIRQQLWVETDFDSDLDGKPDRMHVFVTRPWQTDSFNLKLPIIYSSSPYYGLTLKALMGMGDKGTYWDVKHELGTLPKDRKHTNYKTNDNRPFSAMIYDRQWVSRGFITVYSSSPGTGLSDGVPTIGGENEAQAPKAVIDWLCGRAKAYTTRTGNEEVKAFWSSGKVGMTGTSYDGTLCIAAATTGVKGLEAIIPVAPVTSWYLYYRSNGLVRSPDGYLGEDMDVMYDGINTGDPAKRPANDKRVRDSILAKNMDRKTGDYNDFWETRDYLKNIDKMNCAMIMAHGFNDWNVMSEHSFRFYQAAKEKGLPVKLYYHQAAHGGDPPFPMMNRWFTRYLFGIENGVENDPAVRIVREHGKGIKNYESFPDKDAQPVVFTLQKGENNTGKLIMDGTPEEGTDTLVDNCKFKAADLVKPENTANRLLFLTPPLEQDMRISGTPTVTIKLGSDKAAANLSVYLVALPWEEGKEVLIYDNLVNRAWADPQNYKSLRKGEPLKVGEFYEVKFNMMPDDQIIPKGQQLGLMIFSSDPEFTICPKPGTQLIIDLQGTTLTLPVVKGN